MKNPRRTFFKKFLVSHPSVSLLGDSLESGTLIVERENFQAVLDISEARVFSLIARDINKPADSILWEQLLNLHVDWSDDNFELHLLKKNGEECSAKEDCASIRVRSGFIDIEDDPKLEKGCLDLVEAVNLVFDNALANQGKFEGESRIEAVKRYERNKALRQRAIEIHGLSCCVCDFNFVETYGDLGEHFIHIHHLERLADSGSKLVNPNLDLVPVCPNCHAMIHRRTPPFSPDELRSLINKKG